MRKYGRLKLSAITPADRKRASVVKKNFVFAIAVKLKGAHPREVHNGGPVDAAKDTLIEILFEFGHTAAQQMGSGSDVEARIVICGPDPVNLGGLEKQDLAGILHGEAFCDVWCRPVILDLVLRAAESAFESIIVEGLQQVIERPSFEGPEGILIVGSYEDHRRRRVSAEHFEHVKSVAFRHLNIEEHQVGLRSTDRFERLKS